MVVCRMFRPPLPAAQCRAPISSQKIHKNLQRILYKTIDKLYSLCYNYSIKRNGAMLRKGWLSE